MRRWVALAVLLACGGKPSGTITLVTGGETDVFSQQPAPTTLLVEALTPDGKTTTLAQVALPTSTVDLGDQTQTTVVSLRVSGQDPNGARLVFGSSLFLAYGSLQSANFPVFVQRTGQWARMPGRLDARAAPLLSILNRRSVLVMGGSDPQRASIATGYDLATLAALGNTVSLPRAPRSVLIENDAALLVNDDGASTFSFANGTIASVDPTADLTFAEVAGGSVILGDDGTSYLVGATRLTSPPTNKILVVDIKGIARTAKLLAPRLGAAAAFVPKQGLIVFGGSASASGVELLAPAATTTTALPFKPDATSGAGISLLTGSTVVVAGGVDGTGAGASTRTFDLSCSIDCVLTPWNASPPRVTSARTYGLDASTAIVIGDDDAGSTRSFRLTATSATEAPFKIPRQHARSLVAPNGAVLVVGGGSDVVESYFP